MLTGLSLSRLISPSFHGKTRAPETACDDRAVVYQINIKIAQPHIGRELRDHSSLRRLKQNKIRRRRLRDESGTRIFDQRREESAEGTLDEKAHVRKSRWRLRSNKSAILHGCAAKGLSG